MLFSILIATNNSARVLPIALKSLCSQSCTDYELIVIDNESSDGTLEVIKEFIPSAIIISEPDVGIYDALNKGLLRAKGDWIYVLGSDDQIANKSVLQRVGELVDSNSALIYGNVISTSGSSSKLIRMHPPDYYRSRGIVCPPIFHQSAFIRRSVLSKIGNFPLSLRIHADHFLLTRAFLIATPVYINETICIYHSNGYSGLKLKNYFQSAREQLVINAFFGTSLWRLIKPLAKNFARALINSFKDFLRSERVT